MDQPAEGPTPTDPTDPVWAAPEIQGLEADASRAQEAAESLTTESDRRSRGRWGLFRRQAYGNDHALEADQADDQASLELQVAGEIRSGALAPPAGGPVTPEEEAWVLEHPWPGHSNREAIERERATRAPGSAFVAPPETPGTGAP